MSLSRLIDETQAEMANVRNEPIQSRSSSRIAALVEAAAQVVGEVGVERMTTAMVAERAGASIGTVYRYFPDRIAVLQALSIRTLDLFLRRSREDIAQAKLEHWWDIVLISFDASVALHREDTGFTSIRLGDLVSYPDVESGRVRSGRVAEAFASIASEEFGIENSPELRLRIETAVNIGDALITRAFLADPKGDPTVLAESRSIIESYLCEGA